MINDSHLMDAIERYGFDGILPEGVRGIPARIISAYSGYYKFVSNEGAGIARLKKTQFRRDSVFEAPTTGDWVMIDWNPQGESRILSILPRKTKFERVDPSSSGRKAQILAANFDTLFILMSLNRNFSERRLERFVALARKSSAEVVVLLTKTDIADDAATAMADNLQLDVPTFRISSKTGDGIDKVRAYVKKGKTLVFLGSSGVGKSTLVNVLAGEELMPTFETRVWDDKGRHTTTERELVLLESGAMIVDTPGIRELGMWEMSDREISAAFPDVEQYFGGCRFSDCQHQSESGCAIKNAIEAGDLKQERWEAYLRLKAETVAPVERKGRDSSSTHRYRK